MDKHDYKLLFVLGAVLIVLGVIGTVATSQREFKRNKHHEENTNTERRYYYGVDVK